MNEPRRITLNTEALRRARVTQNLSQRALSRIADIRLGQILLLEKGETCERLTISMLYRLADALSTDVAALLSREHAENQRGSDDVIVEAALAQVGKAVNRDDLAWALGWNLERVNAALKALGARLEGTGQRLREHKFGWYGLSSAAGTLSEEVAADLDRATLSEFGLQLRHAKVLRRLMRGKPLSGVQLTKHTTVVSPVGELLRANLIGLRADGLGINPEVAFSLCLGDDCPTAEPQPLKPQLRKHRARYVNDRSAARTDIDSHRQNLRG
jgi:transcriptional regulator with XRE-family HTH domain